MAFKQNENRPTKNKYVIYKTIINQKMKRIPQGKQRFLKMS